MKKLKTLSLPIALLMAVSCLATSCKHPSENPDNSGLSDIVLEETGNNIVKENATQYSIVIPADASATLSAAASEMKTFLKESTGVSMNVLTDENVSDTAKVISLGDTKFAKANALSTTYEEVEEEGYKIVTKDDDLYILGNSDHGVLYGVYGYLEITLNYDFFYTDVYTIDEVETLPLYNYNVIKKPEFNRRSYTYGFQRYDRLTSYRMRVRNPDEFIMTVKGSRNHNSLDILTPEEYGESGTVEAHPEWFSTCGYQLCFTARGDETSFNRMVEVVTQIMFDEMQMESNKEKDILSMCLEDRKTWCNCTACTTMINEIGYGAHSATIVNFLNKVCVGLEEKLRGVEDARADTFTLYTFAYFKAEAAPVKVEADGTITYHESMKMNKHFTVYYAPISHEYATTPIRGSGAGETMRYWKALSDKMYFWGYNSNFYDWFAAYDSFNTIQDMYRYAKEMNVEYLYIQNKQLNAKSDTGFSLLYAYLQSKLSWNVEEDMDALIEKFHKAMYGIEATNMLNFFEEWRVLSQWQFSQGASGRPTQNRSAKLENVHLWPKNLLVDWVEDLYGMIDRLERTGDTDAAHRVKIEAIFPLYMTLTMFKEDLQESVMRQYALDLKAFTNEAGISVVREIPETHTDELWKELGVD